MTLKKEIENLMLEDQRTKDCDNWLIISYLKSIGLEINLNYLQCKDLPSFELISRTRRKIQEQGKEEFESSQQVREKRLNAQNQFTKEFRKEENSGVLKNSGLIW